MRHLCCLTRRNLLTKTPKQKTSDMSGLSNIICCSILSENQGDIFLSDNGEAATFLNLECLVTQWCHSSAGYKELKEVKEKLKAHFHWEINEL